MAATQNYNLGTITSSSNSTTSTTDYYNNTLGPAFQVSPDVNDAVVSYFEGVADNKESAKILASAVIYTSYSRGINPMSVLQEFSKVSKSDASAYLTLFLNLQRVGTSMLGYVTKPPISKYVQRSILP